MRVIAHRRGTGPGGLGKGRSPCLLPGLVLLFLILFPAPGAHADVQVESVTSLLAKEEADALGGERCATSLYQDLETVWGGETWEADLSAWGRADVGEDQDRDRTRGEVGSAFLRGYLPGGMSYRAGRFTLSQGTALETLDGVSLQGALPMGTGLALFGGNPVQETNPVGIEGDSLAGGRIFQRLGGKDDPLAEVGLTLLKESRGAGRADREEAGADLWLSPLERLEVWGKARYNRDTEGMARQEVRLRWRGEGLDLLLGWEGSSHEDLLSLASNLAFLGTAFDPRDRVKTLSAAVDWQATGSLGLSAGVKRISHEAEDPGEAVKTEAGARWSLGKAFLGLDLASVSADREEDGWQEGRAFGRFPLAGWRVALEGLTQRLGQEVGGSRSVQQVTGSLGRRLGGGWDVAGDVRWLKSPTYDSDVTVFLKARWAWENGKGGR